MRSLVAAHRPELADLVASADLDLEFPGLWLQPHASGVSAAWLAGKLFTAAVESGLPPATSGPSKTSEKLHQDDKHYESSNEAVEPYEVEVWE